MKLTMSKDAVGDGAWGTVLNRLEGFTFTVTHNDRRDTFVGRIYRADDDGFEVTFLVGSEDTRTILISEINEMEYA